MMGDGCVEFWDTRRNLRETIDVYSWLLIGVDHKVISQNRSTLDVEYTISFYIIKYNEYSW